MPLFSTKSFHSLSLLIRSYRIEFSHLNRDINYLLYFTLMRGRLYSSCVRSSMLHGSETWPIRKMRCFSGQRWEWLNGCEAWSYRIEFQVKGWERETRIRWHHLGTTAKQVAMVNACAAKRRQWLGEEMYGVWSGESQASVNFSFFPISILFLLSPYCISNFLIPPPCFLMPAWALTVHMSLVLFPSLHFSSVDSVHLHQGISTLLLLPALVFFTSFLPWASMDACLVQTSYTMFLLC